MKPTSFIKKGWVFNNGQHYKRAIEARKHKEICLSASFSWKMHLRPVCQAVVVTQVFLAVI